MLVEGLSAPRSRLGVTLLFSFALLWVLALLAREYGQCAKSGGRQALMPVGSLSLHGFRQRTKLGEGTIGVVVFLKVQ